MEAFIMLMEVIYSSKWTKGVINKILGTVLAIVKQKGPVETKIMELVERLKAMPQGYDPTEDELRASLAGYHAASDALDKL